MPLDSTSVANTSADDIVQQLTGAVPAKPKSVPRSYAGFSQAEADVQTRKEAETAPLEKEIVEGGRQDKKELNDRYEKLLASEPANVPAPKPPENDPWKSFASSASLFGLIAAAFTKTPAIAGMKAAAAAINSERAGDMETYRQNYEAWKENTELALKRHELMHQEYQDAASKAKDDIEIGNAEYQRIAAKYGDELTMLQMQAGNMHMADQIGLERQRLAVSLQEHKDALQMHHDELMQKEKDRQQQMDIHKDEFAQREKDRLSQFDIQQKEFTQREKDRNALLDVRKDEFSEREKDRREAAELQKKRAEGYDIPLSDSERGLMADQYLAGDRSVLQNLGRGMQGAKNIVLLRQTIADKATAQGLSGADLAGRMAGYQADVAAARTAGTRAAGIDIAARELDTSLPQALEASDKVYRSGLKALDQFAQALKGQANDPQLADFSAANNAVINGYAMAMTRGGVPTVDAQHRAQELLSTATDEDAYEVVLDRLHKETQAMLYGTQQAKQDILNRITGRQTMVQPPVLTAAPRPGPVGGSGGVQVRPQSPEAQADLKSHPEHRDEYDAWYGAGASKAVLGY